MCIFYLLNPYEIKNIYVGYECSDWVGLNVLGVTIGQVCLSLSPDGEVPVATRGERRAVEGREETDRRHTRQASTTTSFTDARTICQVGTVSITLVLISYYFLGRCWWLSS